MGLQNPEAVFDPSEHPKPAPYVLDVEMWSEGDIVSMRVYYSDGTSKLMIAPAVTATGSGVA